MHSKLKSYQYLLRNFRKRSSPECICFLINHNLCLTSRIQNYILLSTAIRLQSVNGLKSSKYLIDKAIQNIEGKITIKENQNHIDSYYKERSAHLSDKKRTDEADKVSSRIVEILSETAFSFSPNEYISIHRKLFQDIYKQAGKIRDYNIAKKVWVLDGAAIIYGSASELRAAPEYDFSQEKDFSCKSLSMASKLLSNLVKARCY